MASRMAVPERRSRPPVRSPRPPVAPPRRRWARRWIILGALLGAIAAGGVLLGVMVIKRMETGTWEVPTAGEFVRIVQRAPDPPSKTIFLERRAITLTPGMDDGPANVSSVLSTAANKPTKLPGWKGSNASWTKVVACVKDLFSPFDVEVTDKPPTHRDYVLTVIGGRPGDLGIKSKNIGGLAPFNGKVISRPVVFAFSAQLNHNVRAICETVAMEVAHAYGLDHGYLCKDVMTYLTGCGTKKFIDKDVPCGESKKRACEGGAATQNSYQWLMRVLGPRKG